MKKEVTIRKAFMEDVPLIHKIINANARHNTLLPRSLQELYENLRDFFIAEIPEKGVVGCCALHITWADLAEVKSLAVVNEVRNKGVGKSLVEACLREARSLGVRRVFALTMIPEFFVKLGFSNISKNELPHKVWSECVRCPYFPDCPEQAVLIVLK
ncbi:N-acetyltransferase [Candidatus Sumerlaeota bacterium]|nr:N-acetyltransferase [Candidatus Sumerlaeota bacterium]